MIPAPQIERAAVAITRLAVELETRPPAIVAAWRFRRRVATAAHGNDERLALAAIVDLPIPRERLASAPWLSKARERFDALVAAEISADTAAFVFRVRENAGRRASWIEAVAETRAAWTTDEAAWAAMEEGTSRALAAGLGIPSSTGIGNTPPRRSSSRWSAKRVTRSRSWRISRSRETPRCDR